MKKGNRKNIKFFKVISFVLSFIFVCSSFTINVFAENNEKNVFDCVKTIHASDNLEEIGADVNYAGSCTHYGQMFLENVTTSGDVQVKLRARVSHIKSGLNSCDHIMSWKIEFVCFAKDSGVILHPHRTRTGSMYPGVVNYEYFALPFGSVFEYRFVTSVAGVNSETEWKRIELPEFSS